MKPTKIHIGSIIKQKVEQSSLSVTEFAKLIHRTRVDVYNIFERSSIDTDLLLDISEVLSYNFMEKFYTVPNKIQITDEYVLIKIIGEDEIPNVLEDNTVLLKKIK